MSSFTSSVPVRAPALERERVPVRAQELLSVVVLKAPEQELELAWEDFGLSAARG